MSAPTDGFYVPFGTMPRSAPSYVAREADRELVDALQRGEFCYVLTSRQMGKSSLMVRSIIELQRSGAAVAVLDLTSQGFTLDAGQWYTGLLEQLGRRLNLLDEVEGYLAEHTAMSPLQAWQAVLADVVLKRIPGRIVIFVDEIDVVRSVSFSTDEFFAAIRSCYNARALEPEWERLTFCLLGVATPPDLIRDARLTPFNVGRRIQLADFSEAQAGLLQAGLGREPDQAARLLRRVLHWTGGHPCLTQRLCKAVLDDSGIQTDADVDACCGDMFFAAGAEHTDDNLTFVRQRLLSGEVDTASLLTLYRQVLEGKRVADDETSDLASVLKLSGVVGVHRGCLTVRNRIYGRVFGRTWVAEHMPDAEVRRQKAAFRRGAIRAASVFGVLALAMVGLTAAAVYQTHVARSERAGKQKVEYVADILAAAEALDTRDYSRVGSYLNPYAPHGASDAQLRGFEWRYLWGRVHEDDHTYHTRGDGIVFSVAYAPDGRTVAASTTTGEIVAWDTTTHRELWHWQSGSNKGVHSLAFSPSGAELAAACQDGSITLRDPRSGRMLSSMPHYGRATSVAFSPDGQWLAAGYGLDPDVKARSVIGLWRLSDRRLVHERSVAGGQPDGVSFSVDSKQVLWVGNPGPLRCWTVPGMLAVCTLPGAFRALSLSPDGRTVALGTNAGPIEIWDMVRRRRNRVLPGHTTFVHSVAFAPDGSRLASGSWDQTARLWDVRSGLPLRILIGHSNRVTGVAFAADGNRLATGALHEVKMWRTSRLRDNPSRQTILRQPPGMEGRGLLTAGRGGGWCQFDADPIGGALSLWAESGQVGSSFRPIEAPNSAALMNDGATWVIGSVNGFVALHRPGSGSADITWAVDQRPNVARGVVGLAISRDGGLLATASGEPAEVQIWDIASRRRLARMGHGNWAAGVAFAPRGHVLAVATWQGEVILWNYRTGQPTPFRAHGMAVNGVAFSPDGLTLATCGVDRTIKLWNVATLRKMVVLVGHKSTVHRVAFSKDGTQLASAGEDGTVLIWHAPARAQCDAKR